MHTKKREEEKQSLAKQIEDSKKEHQQRIQQDEQKLQSLHQQIEQAEQKQKSLSQQIEQGDQKLKSVEELKAPSTKSNIDIEEENKDKALTESILSQLKGMDENALRMRLVFVEKERRKKEEDLVGQLNLAVMDKDKLHRVILRMQQVAQPQNNISVEQATLETSDVYFMVVSYLRNQREIKALSQCSVVLNKCFRQIFTVKVCRWHNPWREVSRPPDNPWQFESVLQGLGEFSSYFLYLF